MIPAPRSAFSSLLERDPRKYILFLGPPGSGLGTYANLLSKDMNLSRISITEEIRKLFRKTSQLKISETMLKESLPVLTKGKIVSSELAIAIIREKLKETQIGATIGGFPRNLVQAEAYERTFPVDLVVYLRVDEDILMETLLGRRSCFKCGTVYNLCKIHRNGYELDKILPKKEGKCDCCGCKLAVRPDDNIETIYSRIYNYRNEGMKVLDYFKRNEKVFEFEPKRGVKDYPKLYDVVQKMLKIENPS